MRKCDKLRIKKIKLLQRIGKCKNALRRAYISTGIEQSIYPHHIDVEQLPDVLNKISSKNLRVLIFNASRFTNFHKSTADLVRLSNEVLMERCFKLR